MTSTLTQDINRTAIAVGNGLATLAQTLTQSSVNTPSPARNTVPKAASPAPGARREITIIMIDISSSMKTEIDGGASRLDTAKTALTNHVLTKHKIDADDHVGLIAFNHEATMLHAPEALRTGKRSLLIEIQQLASTGGTSLAAPLQLAHDQQHTSATNATVRYVLATDGHSMHGLREAEKAKEGGAIIDIIGIGRSPSCVNEKLLKKMASVVDGELRYAFVRDHASFVTRFTVIAEKTLIANR